MVNAETYSFKKSVESKNKGFENNLAKPVWPRKVPNGKMASKVPLQ